MSLINYAEYFDLDGFNKAIKDLETANKEFGNSVLSLNREIKTSYTGIKGELKDYLEFFNKFNVNQRNAAASLAEAGRASQALGARYKDQEAAMQGLIQVQDLSRASLTELKAAAKELEKQYSNLGGASADLNAKKAALAAESSRLRQEITLQQNALKATKKVVDDAAGSYNALNKEALDILRQLKAMPDAFDKTTGKINQNNKAAVELQAKYIGVNDTLKNIDASLGNFQRNVGNYKSGFSGLSNSVNQITREFPAFSNSIQTGFLAISNNLPIFFDELQRANAQIKELQAQGQKVPGLFATLTSSIFSFNTLLSLGVTLLTVFGKDIVEFAERAFSSASKVDVLKESVTSLSAAYKSSDYKKVVTDVAELNSAVKLAKDGFIDKEDVVKKYNETIGKTAGLANNLAEVEQKLTDKAEDVIKFTLLKARANVVLGKAAEAAGNAQIRALEGPTLSDKILGTLRALAGPGKLLGLNSEKLSKDISFELKRAIDGANVDAKSLEDLFKKLDLEATQFAKDKNLNLLGNTKIDKAAENRALNEYRRLLDGRQKALKETFDKEILDAQTLLDQRIISEVEFQDKKYQAAVNYTRLAANEELAINKVGFKARQDKLAEFENFRKAAGNEYLKTLINLDAKALELRKLAIDNEADLNIKSIEDAKKYDLANQLLTNAERVRLEIGYQNQIDEITIKSLQDRAEIEIDINKKTELLRKASLLRRGIDERNAFAQTVTIPQAEARDKIRAIEFVFEKRKLLNQATIFDELATQQAIFKILEESGQLTLEQREQWALKLKKLTLDVNEFILSSLRESSKVAGSILGTGFEDIFNDVIDVLKKLQEGSKITWDNIAQYAIDASNAATSAFKDGIDQQIRASQFQKEQELASVGNNLAARSAIEAKYAREQAALNRKKAVADRDNALFQIGIETGVAVMKAVRFSPQTFGLPWSAYALGVGALQTALVLSRKIPQFKKGTEYAPEGLAIVDDGGGPELIIGPDGRIREIGGNGPRLTYLEKGSKVKTAEETKRLLSDPYGKFNRELALMQDSAKQLSSLKYDESIYIMSKALEKSGMDEKVITSAFERAIRKIPIHQTIIDRYGERKRIIEGENTTTYLNNFRISR